MAHTHHDTGSGTATGMILGIVLVLVVLAIAAFVFFGGAFRSGTTAPTQGGERDTNIQVNPPAPNVDVKVQPAPGGSGQSSPSGTQEAPSKP